MQSEQSDRLRKTDKRRCLITGTLLLFILGFGLSSMNSHSGTQPAVAGKPVPVAPMQTEVEKPEEPVTRIAVVPDGRAFR